MGIPSHGGATLTEEQSDPPVGSSSRPLSRGSANPANSFRRTSGRVGTPYQEIEMRSHGCDPQSVHCGQEGRRAPDAIALYTTRHGMGTDLAAVVSLKEVMETLGHTDAKTALG